MLKVFEVFVAPGHDPDAIITAEVQKETMAQVMTFEQATAVGFEGLKPDAKGREVRYVAVAQRDAQFIQRRLEADEAVASFKVHDVDD